MSDSIPSGHTTYYNISLFNDHDNPGAAQLNGNFSLIDTKIHDAFIGTVYTATSPLAKSTGNVFSLGYRTINLRNNSNLLDTIQDITTNSNPIFNCTNLQDSVILNYGGDIDSSIGKGLYINGTGDEDNYSFIFDGSGWNTNTYIYSNNAIMANEYLYSGGYLSVGDYAIIKNYLTVGYASGYPSGWKFAVNGNSLIQGALQVTNNITNDGHFVSGTPNAGNYSHLRGELQVGYGHATSNGDIVLLNDICSIYTSGYTSGLSGFVLQQTALGSYLEVDDLFVRGSMTVNIFKKNVVKVANGILYIANSARIKTVSSYQISIEKNNDNATFAVGDMLFYQDEQGDNIVTVKATVIDVGDAVSDDNTYELSFTQGGYSNLKVNGTLVNVKPGSFKFDASSPYTPYMDVYSPITSWTDFNSLTKLQSRIGNLAGLTSTSFGALTGYGAYFKGNAYFEGYINALQGSLIANWITETGSIHDTGNYVTISSANKQILVDTNPSNPSAHMKMYFGQISNTGNYGIAANNGTDYIFRLDDYIQQISGWTINTAYLNKGNVYLETTGTKGLRITDGISTDLVKIGDFAGAPNPIGVDYTSNILGTSGSFDSGTDFNAWTQSSAISFIQDTTDTQNGLGSCKFPGYIGTPVTPDYIIYKRVSVSPYVGTTIDVSAYIKRSGYSPTANEEIDFIVSFDSNGYSINTYGGYYKGGDIATTWTSMGPTALKTLTCQVPINATHITITFHIASSGSQSTVSTYNIDTIQIKSYTNVITYINPSGFYAKASANNYIQFTNGSLLIDSNTIKVGGQGVSRWRGSNLTFAPINDLREGDQWSLITGKVYIYTTTGAILLN